MGVAFLLPLGLCLIFLFYVSFLYSIISFVLLFLFYLQILAHLNKVQDMLKYYPLTSLSKTFKVMLGSSITAQFEHCSDELINVKVLCQIIKISILLNHIPDSILNFNNDTYCSRILCHIIVDPLSHLRVKVSDAELSC